MAFFIIKLTICIFIFDILHIKNYTLYFLCCIENIKKAQKISRSRIRTSIATSRVLRPTIRRNGIIFYIIIQKIFFETKKQKNTPED